MKLHPPLATPRTRWNLLPRLARCTALVATLATALPSHAQGRDSSAAPPPDKAGFSIGLSAEPLTSPEALGLATYPGARIAPENGPDGERRAERGQQGTRGGNDMGGSGSLNLWGGAFGLQLRAVRLISGDSVAAVSDFYRSALARHGTVLDCSAAAGSREPSAADKQALRCGDDRPAPGGTVLKAGRRSDMRLVSIKPSEQGTQIQLLHLVVRGD